MKAVFFLACAMFLLSVPLGYAQSDPIDYLQPKITVPKDIYVATEVPVKVNFKVNAVDDIDGEISVECDKISGSVFKIGKTTVRCQATDTSGKMSTASFLVTLGYNIVDIPSWVKQTTKYWTDGDIDDSTYAETMGYLIQEKIIKVPFAKTPNYSETEIPVWIKTNAQYWTEGNISDDEYSIMLQWLINRNIIKII